MSTYFRYHIASGHVDSKLTVVDEDSMSLYQKSGYGFVETSLPFGLHYVENGQTKPRVKIEGESKRLNGMTTEPRIITGLPDDCWVSINAGGPVKTTNGNITVMPSNEGVMVTIVGKYYGPQWKITWDNLLALKVSAKEHIDLHAELARQKVITPGSGQAMTYLRKADAARAFLANQAISEAQMQRISDEANLRNCSIEDAATAIVGMADAWENIDVSIDNIRLTAKAEIDEAATGQAIESILTNITWPTV